MPSPSRKRGGSGSGDTAAPAATTTTTVAAATAASAPSGVSSPPSSPPRGVHGRGAAAVRSDDDEAVYEPRVVGGITQVDITHFEAWLSKRLSSKYTHGLAGVHDALSVVLRELWEMGELGRAVEAACGGTTPLPASVPYASNVVAAVEACALSLPLCIESEWLQRFVRGVWAAQEQVIANVHVLQHVGLSDRAAQTRLTATLHQLHTAAATRLRALIHELQRACDLAEPLTANLHSYLAAFRASIADIATDLHALQQGEPLQTRFTHAATQHRADQARFLTAANVPALTRARYLEQRCASTREAMLAMLAPFVRICKQLHESGAAAVVEGGDLRDAERESIQHWGRVLTHGEDDVLRAIVHKLDAFVESLFLLGVAGDQHLLGLSKRNRELLVESCEKLDVASFCNAFDTWQECDEELRAIKADAAYSGLVRESDMCEAQHRAARATMERAVRETHHHLFLFNRLTQTTRYVGVQVAKFCWLEFGERVELVLPPLDAGKHHHHHHHHSHDHDHGHGHKGEERRGEKAQEKHKHKPQKQKQRRGKK